MDERQALSAFAALAQETRLRLLRQLVTAGPEGVAAGALASEAGVSASNVSFHLKELEQAGLAASRRDGRSIIYSAAYPALSGLIAFLMQDCCQGRPEVCSPAIAALAACACHSDGSLVHA
jgi:ArsR family transcriptional regulator, arsenate/arsenite/antimonite-responsive transcriptional repressor